MTLTKMTHLAPDWKNYCIYSGQHLPDAALNEEHVIPKSLGGYRSTAIRASRNLNSHFATTIDGQIANDPMVQFGRRDADARGHSKKKPRAIIRRARSWKPGDPWGEGDTRYTLEIQTSGPPKIFDTKTQQFLPPNILTNMAFVIPDWKIDHIARLRFVLKTLLGVGWKFFRTDLLSAIDTDKLRSFLTTNISLSTERHEGSLTYADPFLVEPEHQGFLNLKKVEAELIRPGQTTILIRSYDERLEWSIACLGHLIGSICVPCRGSLLAGDVRPRGGIRLMITRDRLAPQLVAPID